MLDYIIVQAGGKGTRLEYLTKNKPKCLVSINNLPMIFHLFKMFPNKKFIIIGDYKFDVLKKYLDTFADVDYKLVCASGHKGTLSGLKEAISYIEDKKRFMLIWSDLVLNEDFKKEEIEEDGNFVGLSQTFPCRWRFENGKFEEISSSSNGVAGLFVFEDKRCLKDLPEDGEFVRYLSTQNINLKKCYLPKTQEFGLLQVVENIKRPICRPFNKITFLEDRIVKEPIDEQGFKLGRYENNWYKYVSSCNSPNLPRIYSFDPLTIEKIGGGTWQGHLYNLGGLQKDQRAKILNDVINCLKDVHNIQKAECDFESFVDAYLTKTFKRLDKIKGLVPFADKEKIVVNGKECRNILFYIKEVATGVFRYYPKQFCLIHGDSTFSNILMDGHRPVLIDPRGYFGKVELFGDEAYDWAKLYYSIVGNYDQFNLGEFRLSINEDNVELKIKSSGFEDLEEEFFKALKGNVSRQQMKLYHAIIWYSLTTYAWNDYDSICGAFYKGCELLEEYFKGEGND